jgi:beta-mannosidase
VSGRVVAVSGHDSVLLADHWSLCATPADAFDDPAGLSAIEPERWVDARLPATAASALRAAGMWSLDGPERRFDAEDWWWRCRFSEHGDAAERALCFDGIATVADVWLDGRHLFASDNMFQPIERIVELGGTHELVIRCRSLDALLKVRRARPRWRAPMVEHQRLCWFRTTLLGRTPGWSPPAAAVGPWRPVRIERRRGLVVESLALNPRIDGDRGLVGLAAELRSLGASIDAAELVLERAGESWRGGLAIDGTQLQGELAIPEVCRWWPFTHGEPALYQAELHCVAAGETIVLRLGAVGFRELSLDLDDGDFRLQVNGEAVFCRGACWTPLDPVTLHASPEAYRAALQQLVDAGMNMVRVGGTMVYESSAFYDAADELGILVWQDLMFANMDYPSDPSFVAGVEREVATNLSTIGGHPSLAVLCGNSEGEQQSAMWGAPRATWAHPLFHETLRAVAERCCPAVPYWPSSAHGGAFPHQCNVGTTSYYGVGAYLRPLEDARRADVRFASECLAFANVPSSVAAMPDGHATRAHQATWKRRAPRDLDAGWDFDDVRDHYLAELFGVDPMKLRYADHERYLALGRVVVGEVMAATFAEWRRAGSRCGGGLVWFLRDLWRGAGWGIVDADGQPKSGYHYLRRALQPIAVHFSDEGNNGLDVQLHNERPEPLEVRLELSLFRGDVALAGHARDLSMPARSRRSMPAAELLEGFVDLSYAFRFGPPACDLAVARLWRGDERLAEAFHLPLGLAGLGQHDLGFEASAEPLADGDATLTLTTRSHAHAVAIEVPGYWPADDFVHLAPGDRRCIHLHRTPAAKRLSGTAWACNARDPVRIVAR